MSFCFDARQAGALAMAQVRAPDQAILDGFVSLRERAGMLSNKVAIVTGASSGIGRAVAVAFAQAGAKVVVSDVNREGGEKTVALVREGAGEASFIAADVSRPENCEALVRFAVQTYGQLDVACNNAGIGGGIAQTADYPLDVWQQVIGVNLSGVFHCMKYQIPELLKTRGAIVNVASILGQVGFPGAAAYTAAKHGVLGLTRVAALEYAARGVRVNAVGPGFIHTPMIAGLESDAATNAQLIAMHPIGRLGEPGEVAELVLWLASPRAAFVTGAYYPIDGGFLAR
jgi:NAD(P)-dependent dehydrogenase (short-subunit alcohol dehydrogenase family)